MADSRWMMAEHAEPPNKRISHVEREAPVPISIAAMLLGVLFVASTSAYAQSNTRRAGLVSGSLGVFAGSFRPVDANNPVTNNPVNGAWLDLSFGGWELGTIEVDLFQNRRRERRVDACPSADCSERYVADSDGKPKRINDRLTSVAPALESQRIRAFSFAFLKRFSSTPHVAPHWIVGLERLSHGTSFHFDDPTFEERTYSRRAWGPVGGIGLDILAGRFIARLQYRVDPIPVGQECILVCNNQFRLGAGWAF